MALIKDVKPNAVLNYHEMGKVIYYQKSSPLLSVVYSKTGYTLIHESLGDAHGTLGDWLTAKGIAWCTPETCYGSFPISHWQLYSEWENHKDMLPAIAYAYKGLYMKKETARKTFRKVFPVVS